MSFENAPVSKGLMIGVALSSIVVGLFDVKHYFHLQLLPHISRHHQYWRLGAHYLAFSSSSDLFMAEVLLYNLGVSVERQFGSVKFASFAIVSTLLSMALEFFCLLLFYRIGLNYIPSGPFALIFSIMYQYSRIVPSAYRFRIFGLPLNNKSFIYFLALQLAIGQFPGSTTAAAVGILSGQLYRADILNLKGYRVSPNVVTLSKRTILPLLGSTRPSRRSNRALPDEGQSRAGPNPQNDEVITTARQPPTSSRNAIFRARGGREADGTGSSVVREWVDELRGRTGSASGGVRIPTEGEITHLTTMFPDIPRETIVGALQRSPNVESAVETLLSSQA